MADFVFNIAKGRVGELFNRVDGNDPANSAIILVPFSASGSEAQGQDLATLAAVEADANFAELTTGSWARVILTDTQLAATNSEVDNTNNRWDVSIPQTSMGSPTSGTTTGLVICYDSDTTGGADSAIVPLTHHTFAVVADSNEVVINAGDILRAS